jgi:hypothetical protein
MSHYAREKSDAAWVDTKPVDPAGTAAGTIWKNWDDKLAKVIDGHDGGTYSPQPVGGAGLTIGGAGLWLGAYASIEAVNDESRIITPSGSGKRITFESGWFQLKSGHPYRSATLLALAGRAWDIANNVAALAYDASLDAMALPVSGRALVPLRVHNGATFTSARFFFRVAGGHAGVPAQLPRFRVFKRSAAGVVTNLRAATSGYLTMPTPASVAAYENGAGGGLSGLQSVLFTCDASQVIDTSAFTYFAEVISESGTNALTGLVFHGVDVSMTSIADLRPQ